MWKIEYRYERLTRTKSWTVTNGTDRERFTDKDEAEARCAELNEAILAPRRAKAEAYGDRLVVKIDSKAAATRRIRRYVVLDADGNEIASYASLDEVPELDEPIAEPVKQVEATQPAAVQPEAPARGTITDAQAATLTRLIADGEGGGIFHITDAEIPTLSREGARLLIDSLRGDI